MAVSFLLPELSRWDALALLPDGPPELLVLPVLADERPLRGAAGLADWRLCGRLSRLVLGGRVDGSLGESTLLPGGRLPFPRIVLFGIGASDGFDEARFREATQGVRRVVRELHAARVALALPGRATGLIVARRALELWLEIADERTQTWIIEQAAAQKEMGDGLGRAARR